MMLKNQWLNGPGFNSNLIAWKEKKRTIEGNQNEPTKDPPLTKLVFLFQRISMENVLLVKHTSVC